MNTLIIAICSVFSPASMCCPLPIACPAFVSGCAKPFMNMAMVLGLFPGFMSMIAVYFILKAVGLSEGSMIRLALILCYSGSAALGFQIAKGFFDTSPYAIDEAALIDGCTRGQIFTKITLPLSKPIVIYTVLTAFIGPWVDFFRKVSAAPIPTSTLWPLACGRCWKRITRRWYTCFAAAPV